MGRPGDWSVGALPLRATSRSVASVPPGGLSGRLRFGRKALQPSADRPERMVAALPTRFCARMARLRCGRRPGRYIGLIYRPNPGHHGARSEAVGTVSDGEPTKAGATCGSIMGAKGKPAQGRWDRPPQEGRQPRGTAAADVRAVTGLS